MLKSPFDHFDRSTLIGEGGVELVMCDWLTGISHSRVVSKEGGKQTKQQESEQVYIHSG